MVNGRENARIVLYRLRAEIITVSSRIVGEVSEIRNFCTFSMSSIYTNVFFPKLCKRVG